MDKLKKTGFVSAMAFAFLLVASAVAFATGFIPCPEQSYAWAYLCLGVFILIVSGLTAFVIRKNTVVNAICFSVNAVALGCLIRAWYIFRELDNSIITMLLVCLACLAYIWLFFLCCLIPFFSRHLKLFFWLWLFVSCVAYMPVVAFTKTDFVSTFGYYMLVLCAFIYAMVSDSENFSELMRALTLSTYSVFVVAIIVAVIMLTEDCDFSVDFAGNASVGETNITDSEQKNKNNTDE